MRIEQDIVETIFTLRESLRPTQAAPAISVGPASLESVLLTAELNRRSIRPPDYETENRALTALAVALADSPRTILQTLADTLLSVFKAGSAGLSLLTKDEKHFFWPAIAGLWQPHVGGGTPRDFGPCGDVLDANSPLLFTHFERRYPYLVAAAPAAVECLLVPFYVKGKAVGTIWAIAHDERRKFDAEDLRQIQSLSRFASAAYQAVELVCGAQATEAINAQLRESQDQYRTLFELEPVAVYSCDASGMIQKFNRRAAELWGREPKLGDSDELFCGSFKLFLVEGSFMPHEQCPMARVVSGQIIVQRRAHIRFAFRPYRKALRSDRTLRQ